MAERADDAVANYLKSFDWVPEDPFGAILSRLTWRVGFVARNLWTGTSEESPATVILRPKCYQSVPSSGKKGWA
jgi:hypothetical protein